MKIDYPASVEGEWDRVGTSPRPPDDPPRRVLTDAEVRDLERVNPRAALEAAGGGVARPAGAAARLGIPASTFASRLKSIGIEPKHRP